MRILETVYQANAPRIDAEAGVLYGVKLLGVDSRNGRRYTAEAINKAVNLYDGRKIYLDHPSRDKAGVERSFRDWVGEARNPQARPDGIYGDVHLRTKTEYFEGIIEAAEKFPKAVGFSHVADGESRVEGDTEIIESITEVFSVDLVTDPATTAGIFESKTPPTAEESLSAIKTRLTEMLDSEYFDGATGGEKSDPQSQMLGAVLKTLDKLTEVVMDLSAKIGASQQAAPPELPEPMEDAEMASEPTSEPVDAEAAPPESPIADEQLNAMRRENAELKAKTLLLESGREATPVRVKALAAANEADQAELLESWPLAESTERPARSPALVESVAGEIDFSNPGSFAARYR